MTREERLQLLKQIEKDIHVCSIESTFLDDAKSCAIHSAIEELKQEPILDKIYVDIQSLRNLFCIGTDAVIDEVEDIIDKYRKVRCEYERYRVSN